MKITLDKPKCIGCGVCASLCPKYFEMKEGKSYLPNSKVIPGTETDELEVKDIEECAKEAVNSCPVRCIQISK